MNTMTFRPLANPSTHASFKSLLDFTNMANQEWDNWVQRQGTIKIEARDLDQKQMIASNICLPEPLFTGMEDFGGEVICPAFCCPPFLFDDPALSLDDLSSPLAYPSFPLDGLSSQLVDPSFQADESDPFLHLSSSPKIEPIIQPLQEVAPYQDGLCPLAEKEKPNLQRKATSQTGSQQGKTKKSKSASVLGQRRQRTYRLDSHNAIEKRYRSGINECIDRLRQVIPPPALINEEFTFSEEDDDGSITEKEGKAALLKDGKGDVLSRALKYIKYLEANTGRLCNEVVVLNARLRAFEEME
jgi:Helix-loop-helix DNA-binding domain